MLENKLWHKIIYSEEDRYYDRILKDKKKFSELN